MASRTIGKQWRPRSREEEADRSGVDGISFSSLLSALPRTSGRSLPYVPRPSRNGDSTCGDWVPYSIRLPGGPDSRDKPYPLCCILGRPQRADCCSRQSWPDHRASRITAPLLLQPQPAGHEPAWSVGLRSTEPASWVHYNRARAECKLIARERFEVYPVVRTLFRPSYGGPVKSMAEGMRLVWETSSMRRRILAQASVS